MNRLKVKHAACRLDHLKDIKEYRIMQEIVFILKLVE